jgi:Cu2+-exporting ATPase
MKNDRETDRMKNLVRTYPVSGMSCASCALNVERTLKRQPGVAGASVNYASGSAIIELRDPGVKSEDLQNAIRSIGYDLIIEEEKKLNAEANQLIHYRQLRSNMIWSLMLALPVMIISMFFMQDGEPQIPFQNYIMLVLTVPVIAWFGRSFFINAFKLARHGQSNMDTLVALSTGIAFLFSLFNTFYPQFWHNRGLHPHVYYEASAVVIAFILIGKVLEERAKSKTSSAIKKLMGLQPTLAILIDSSGNGTTIPIAEVRHNDSLRVKPGDKIPVDGEIISGYSSIDESTITGESMPADKTTGDRVFAGTMNINGSFILRAQQVGSETVLYRIIEMVQKAQGSKAPVQKTVDRVAGIFVPIVMSISLASFIIWMVFGGQNTITHALLAMVTVLVIACPCALGLATPTAIMVGMGKAARNGILIKDAESLERMHQADVIVVDKTGTLTEGKPAVTEIKWLKKDHNGEYSRILLAMEKQSAHPLANAIVAALDKNLTPVHLDSFGNISGKGLKASYQGDTYVAGNLKLMDDEGIIIDPQNSLLLKSIQEQANTVVVFARNLELIAVISLADVLKATSGEAVKQLKRSGIAVYMLTGDNRQTAEAIATAAGIEEFRANLLPSDKADFIKDLQLKGHKVAMVGDGVNDSHAMAQADVSIAMAKGSDVAMDVAGITIMSSDLMQIPKAIRLSGFTVKTIHQNLFWAFIYNLIGLPLAAGVLYPIWGFMLNPMIAAAAMALSSVSVVTNSLRLRTKKI